MYIKPNNEVDCSITYLNTLFLGLSKNVKSNNLHLFDL